jgi:hypothetical protein
VVITLRHSLTPARQLGIWQNVACGLVERPRNTGTPTVPSRPMVATFTWLPSVAPTMEYTVEMRKQTSVIGAPILRTAEDMLQVF